MVSVRESIGVGRIGLNISQLALTFDYGTVVGLSVRIDVLVDRKSSESGIR